MVVVAYYICDWQTLTGCCSKEVTYRKTILQCSGSGVSNMHMLERTYDQGMLLPRLVFLLVKSNSEACHWLPVHVK